MVLANPPLEEAETADQSIDRATARVRLQSRASPVHAVRPTRLVARRRPGTEVEALRRRGLTARVASAYARARGALVHRRRQPSIRGARKAGEETDEGLSGRPGLIVKWPSSLDILLAAGMGRIRCCTASSQDRVR